VVTDLCQQKAPKAPARRARENDVEVMAATVAADVPMGEEVALDACGWSPEFMSCFYSARTIAECRSE
jgi:hypothetical protein